MTAIVLVTHDRLGAAMLRIVRTIAGRELPVRVVAVDVGDDTEAAGRLLGRELASAGAEALPLVLTDLPGATPHNLAVRAVARSCPGAPLVTGLNLPMLLRAINHGDRPAAELADLAAAGARRAVLIESGDGH